MLIEVNLYQDRLKYPVIIRLNWTLSKFHIRYIIILAAVIAQSVLDSIGTIDLSFLSHFCNCLYQKVLINVWMTLLLDYFVSLLFIAFTLTPQLVDDSFETFYVGL